MGNVVFQQILHLIGKGYTVNLSKADELRPGQFLRIELRDGEYRHMELVDMGDARTLNVYNTVEANTEYLISRALSRAEWELEYYIEKETNGND